MGEVMAQVLTVALIRASLPSYFPERHGVWARAEAALAALCAAQGARLFVVPEVPMDARKRKRRWRLARQRGRISSCCCMAGSRWATWRARSRLRPLRAGFWSVPEPRRTGDVQLNNFVSLNMSLSIARQVRDLRRNPVQWYHGAPESPALQARLTHTLRALAAAKALTGARIGVIGGLAMTFYNMEVSSNALRARLGVEVAHHDMHELTGRMAALAEGRVEAEVRAMAAAARVDGVSAAQMALTARCALALRDMAQAGGYAALAVSDWPALAGRPRHAPRCGLQLAGRGGRLARRVRRRRAGCSHAAGGTIAAAAGSAICST